jgi:Holliday junction resolvase-like predicted endonuclease
MKYEARKFSQKSYNQNDSKAKDLVCNWLINKNYEIINHQENFQHDIIAQLNNKQIHIEVEFKTGYSFTNKESFRFDTVSFLGRKERLHHLKPFLYIIICKETNWAVCAKSSTIFNKQYIETLNIQSRDRSGEDLMFRVPKEMCTFFKL